MTPFSHLRATVHVMRARFLFASMLLLCWLTRHFAQSFAPSIPPVIFTKQSNNDCRHTFSRPIRRRTSNIAISHSNHPRGRTNLLAINAGIASLLAGSVGGAIGVGVAYPFDTLKTKAQVYSMQPRSQLKSSEEESIQHLDAIVERSTARNDGEQQQQQQQHPGMVHVHSSTAYVPITSPEDDLISLIKLIFQLEGISGFFGGVRAMMVGQAIIKSVAFGANEFMLGILRDENSIGLVVDGTMQQDGDVSFTTLLIAASFSGFVTSFLVAPVERVKVMMQAQNAYSDELQCIQAVLKNEGWTGLFSRGLGPTLAREVPSYAIYFVVYGVLMQSEMAGRLEGIAPLIFGAVSGCACWIPVYPIDVVKTLVQNTEGGGETTNSVDVAIQLYNEEGIGAFFNGLTPKMIRASVNHSVTFWVYDLVMKVLV